LCGKKRVVMDSAKRVKKKGEKKVTNKRGERKERERREEREERERRKAESRWAHHSIWYERCHVLQMLTNFSRRKDEENGHWGLYERVC